MCFRCHVGRVSVPSAESREAEGEVGLRRLLLQPTVPQILDVEIETVSLATPGFTMWVMADAFLPLVCAEARDAGARPGGKRPDLAKGASCALSYLFVPFKRCFCVSPATDTLCPLCFSSLSWLFSERLLLPCLSCSALSPTRHSMPGSP